MIAWSIGGDENRAWQVDLRRCEDTWVETATSGAQGRAERAFEPGPY